MGVHTGIRKILWRLHSFLISSSFSVVVVLLPQGKIIMGEVRSILMEVGGGGMEKRKGWVGWVHHYYYYSFPKPTLFSIYIFIAIILEMFGWHGIPCHATSFKAYLHFFLLLKLCISFLVLCTQCNNNASLKTLWVGNKVCGARWDDDRLANWRWQCLLLLSHIIFSGSMRFLIRVKCVSYMPSSSYHTYSFRYKIGEKGSEVKDGVLAA